MACFSIVFLHAFKIGNFVRENNSYHEQNDEKGCSILSVHIVINMYNFFNFAWMSQKGFAIPGIGYHNKYIYDLGP